MAELCPNCQKPVLPADVICWHCGYQLTRQPKGHPAPAAAGRTARDRDEAAPAEYDFRALAVYGLLTLAIILGLWLVMRSLGRQPILVRSARPDFGGDWVSVTDVDLRYTLSFPTDWQWLDVAYRDQGELLTRVIDRYPYIGRALDPLGDVVGDVEITGVAGDVETAGVAVDGQTPEEVEPRPFVVIGRSERLRDLEAQAALDLLTARSLPVAETGIDAHLAGQPQARFSLSDSAHAYQCRHLFVADAGVAGYLVAACAPQTQYGVFQQDLHDILDSFQLLE